MQRWADAVSFELLSGFFGPCQCLPAKRPALSPLCLQEAVAAARRRCARGLLRAEFVPRVSAPAGNTGAAAAGMHVLEILPRCCPCTKRRNKIRETWRFRDTGYCAGKVPSETKISFFCSYSHLHLFVCSIALSTTAHLAHPCSAKVFLGGFSCHRCHCPSPSCCFFFLI